MSVQKVTSDAVALTTSDVHEPAANTAAVVTYAAPTLLW